MVINGASMVINGDLMVIGGDLPSGKHTKNYGKIHHAINGTTHYFNGHFQ